MLCFCWITHLHAVQLRWQKYETQMIERVERFAVRVVLFDSTGSVLLLSTRDFSNDRFPSPGRYQVVGFCRRRCRAPGLFVSCWRKGDSAREGLDTLCRAQSFRSRMSVVSQHLSPAQCEFAVSIASFRLLSLVPPAQIPFHQFPIRCYAILVHSAFC
jgi:hypothetical protein